MYVRQTVARAHAQVCACVCVYAVHALHCITTRARWFPMSQVGSRSIWFARVHTQKPSKKEKKEKEEGNSLPYSSNQGTVAHSRIKIPSVEKMSWLLRFVGMLLTSKASDAAVVNWCTRLDDDGVCFAKKSADGVANRSEDFFYLIFFFCLMVITDFKLLSAHPSSIFSGTCS